MDYFEAKFAIAEILAEVPDAELPDVDTEERDGLTIAWDEEEQIGYHLGSTTINGEAVRNDFRSDAVAKVLAMEAVHRAEAKWWMRHGAALAAGVPR